MKNVLENKDAFLVLNFLATERWATRRSIHLLLKYKYYEQTIRLLNAMLAEGLLSSDMIRESARKGVYVVFITTHGMSLVADFDVLDKFRPMSLSRIAMNSLNHNIDLLMLHVACVHKGFKNYWKPDYLFREKNVHYADAFALKGDLKYCFEVERTVKSVVRYSSILGHYANEIKNKNADRIVYLSPSISVTKRLTYIFKKIETIDVNGETFAKPDNLLTRFDFFTYEEFGF